MNSTFSIKYGSYLTSLIASVANETAPPKPFEDINWEWLYGLASFHNVAVLIYPAVQKLNPPADILKKFEYNCHRMMAREARQEIEAQRIFKRFKEENIKFIILKGNHLKNIYPAPYMRTQADVDICMSCEDRLRGKALMLSMGYTLDGSIDYHDEYSKDNYFIYELHSDIMSKNSPFYEIFANPFDKVKNTSSDNMSYVFTDEYFYLHLFLHLYKHFVSEGCGIRLFCDLFLFRKHHPDLDEKFIFDILKNYGLTEFYEHISELLLCFFEGKEFDETHKTIAEFILKSGEYGSSHLKRISWLSSDKSANVKFSDKVKYFMGNWFPGVRVMKKRYPVLEKAPVLLPICWVRRGFYTIFFKKEALKEQQKEIQKFSSDEMKDAKKVRALAGVK